MLYVPTSFAVARPDTLHALMRQNGFATLISPDAGDPWITHLPLVLQADAGGHGMLLGHFARSNPHWQRIATHPEVLAVFHGPHAYVSPSLYRTHPSVPTWNYAVVHAHGRARLIDDVLALEDMLAAMVERYEQARPHPWQMALPESYFDGMVRGVVGIEIAITRLTGKFKLSQNRPQEDRQAVTQAFDAGDAEERAVAAWMKAGDL